MEFDEQEVFLAKFKQGTDKVVSEGGTEVEIVSTMNVDDTESGVKENVETDVGEGDSTLGEVEGIRMHDSSKADF